MNPLDADEPFMFEVMNPNPSSSKTKDGPKYRVSFELQKDDWQAFMDAETKGMVLELSGRVVAQNQSIPEDKPKGGPLSKNAAMLCQDPESVEFAKAQGYDDFKAMIYHHCSISSRAQLDHNPRAADLYEALKHRYFRWAGEVYG